MSTTSDPATKDSSGSETSAHKHLTDEKTSRQEAMAQIQRAASISMSPELFEKLYLSPQNKVHGDLRKTFANPTPLAALGLAMALTPFSCDIMG